MKETLGFIGLGIMGKPMALNLIESGHKLNILDHKVEVMKELESYGAQAMVSPKETASQSDIVITMLPDSPNVEEVTLGEDGLIHGLSDGMLYIDMSTINAETEIKINWQFQEFGTDTLDAPVSGGQGGAEDGTLSIMVGGSEGAFNRALPLFEILGERISHMGDVGSGQITKSCNQIATALATQGVIEALTLAKKAGVDPGKVRNALLGGFAQSKALELAGEKMNKRDFTPGFKVNLYRKDLRIAQEMGRSLSVSLPGTAFLATEMDGLIAQGKGNLDFSALIEIIEQKSGL